MGQRVEFVPSNHVLRNFHRDGCESHCLTVTLLRLVLLFLPALFLDDVWKPLQLLLSFPFPCLCLVIQLFCSRVGTATSTPTTTNWCTCRGTRTTSATPWMPRRRAPKPSDEWRKTTGATPKDFNPGIKEELVQLACFCCGFSVCEYVDAVPCLNSSDWFLSLNTSHFFLFFFFAWFAFALMF